MQKRQTRVNPSEENIAVGPIEVRFLISGEESDDSVSVFEFSVPAWQKLPAPAHRNNDYEEVIYGLKGVLTWTIDGKRISVCPGQSICITRGAVHRFDNLGNEDAKQLVVITPAIMGPAYFREAAEVINSTGGRPTDPARMMEVFRRHGMTLVLPDPAR